jgi:hypothetical protein
MKKFHLQRGKTCGSNIPTIARAWAIWANNNFNYNPLFTFFRRIVGPKVFPHAHSTYLGFCYEEVHWKWRVGYFIFL